MADNEEMKEIVAGMIDRDMLIRWTFEAKDREIETLKIANGIFSGRIEELEQIVKSVAESETTYHDGYDDKCCIFCHGEEDFATGEYRHEDTCLTVKARKLLG